MEYYLAVKKDGSATWTNQGESQKHCSKRKLADTKEYILHDFILTTVNNKQNYNLPVMIKSRTLVTSVGVLPGIHRKEARRFGVDRNVLYLDYGGHFIDKHR